MILPVIHRMEIVQGQTPGSLAAVPKLMTEDGTVIDSGDQVALKAGQSVVFGPFKLEVSHEASFSTGDTPKQDGNASGGKNPQGSQPALKR